MIKKFLTTLTAAALIFGVVASPVFATTAYAGGSGGGSSAAKSAACEGVELTGGNCNDPVATGNQVNSVLATVINIFSFVVGFTAVIMIIIGGFKYVTSTGDSASINSAKNTILYAVIGLVIVALAQVIVRFVLTRI